MQTTCIMVYAIPTAMQKGILDISLVTKGEVEFCFVESIAHRKAVQHFAKKLEERVKLMGCIIFLL